MQRCLTYVLCQKTYSNCITTLNKNFKKMSRTSHGKLFLSFFKNWSIVYLQCCVSFWCTTKWFSFIFRVCVCVCVCACACAKSCAALCNSLDCTLPGSSVHGIFQVTIQEWVATSCSKGSSWSRDWTHVSSISCISRQFLYHHTTLEVPYYFSYSFLIHHRTLNVAPHAIQ